MVLKVVLLAIFYALNCVRGASVNQKVCDASIVETFLRNDDGRVVDYLTNCEKSNRDDRMVPLLVQFGRVDLFFLYLSKFPTETVQRFFIIEYALKYILRSGKTELMRDFMNNPNRLPVEQELAFLRASEANNTDMFLTVLRNATDLDMNAVYIQSCFDDAVKNNNVQIASELHRLGYTPQSTDIRHMYFSLSEEMRLFLIEHGIYFSYYVFYQLENGKMITTEDQIFAHLGLVWEAHWTQKANIFASLMLFLAGEKYFDSMLYISRKIGAKAYNRESRFWATIVEELSVDEFNRLLDAGIEVYFSEQSSKHALLKIIRTGKSEFLDVFVERGLMIHQVDALDNNLFIIEAISEGNLEAFEKLENFGASTALTACAVRKCLARAYNANILNNIKYNNSVKMVQLVLGRNLEADEKFYGTVDY